jgi:hypothetical protein
MVAWFRSNRRGSAERQPTPRPARWALSRVAFTLAWCPHARHQRWTVVDDSLRHGGVTPARGRWGNDAVEGEGSHQRRLDGGGTDRVDRSDDGGDLRGNGGSEVTATRAHGGADDTH